ncbi:7008_t:CDS:2, partial [Acaulospora colombiana]
MSLPLELLIPIVEFALEDHSDYQYGRIGHNAAWKMPRPNTLSPPPIQNSRPDAGPFNRNGSNVDDEIKTTGRAISDAGNANKPLTGFHVIATALRLYVVTITRPTSTYLSIRVCRTFNKIVIPILYRDISLLVDRKYLPSMNTILNQYFLPHAQYIQSLYIWGNHPDSLEECNVRILQECVNLTSLGLYFVRLSSMNEEWKRVQDAVVSLIEGGKLTHLGLYSHNIFQGGVGPFREYGANEMIKAIYTSETARFHLKGVDVTFTWLDEAQQVLSGFPNLESLSIQQTLFIRRLRLWRPLALLTKLQIYNCSGILASDIPDLILSFPALRTLMVSKVSLVDPELPFHVGFPKGWHLFPNAICNTHQQLDLIHIDYLSRKQIEFIGLIPTRILVATSINPPELMLALTADLHYFPGLKILQRGVWARYEGIDPDTASPEVSLNKWCAARNVEVVEASYCAFAGQTGPWFISQVVRSSLLRPRPVELTTSYYGNWPQCRVEDAETKRARQVVSPRLENRQYDCDYVFRSLCNEHAAFHGSIYRLQQASFYSPEIVGGGNTFHDYWTVAHVIEAISKSATASSRLKSLDLAVWSVPNMRVDWIQSKFSKLESITIRCSLPAMRSMDQWKPSAFLTRLQLNNCDPIAASDIPDLVALFPALRELTVADPYPSPNERPFYERYPGWHLLPSALCNTHRRLDWVHCDHLYAHEIQLMGLIPTRTLIVTGVEATEVARVLESDPHIFPGVEVLWREVSMEYPETIAQHPFATDALNRWCAARNIEVIEGAKGAYGSYSS